MWLDQLDLLVGFEPHRLCQYSLGYLFSKK